MSNAGWWQIWSGPGVAVLVREGDPDEAWLTRTCTSGVKLRMAPHVTPERAEEVFTRACRRYLVPRPGGDW